MVNSKTMLQAAENCLALASETEDERARRRFMRMACAWQDLAELQDWLEGQVSSRPSMKRAA